MKSIGLWVILIILVENLSLWDIKTSSFIYKSFRIPIYLLNHGAVIYTLDAASTFLLQTSSYIYDIIKAFYVIFSNSLYKSGMVSNLLKIYPLPLNLSKNFREISYALELINPVFARIRVFKSDINYRSPQRSSCFDRYIILSQVIPMVE